MKRRDVVEQKCCTDRKCYICAGTNRKLVIVEIEYNKKSGNFRKNSDQENRVLVLPRNDEQSRRAKPLSAEDVDRLKKILSMITNGRQVIASVCNVSIRTVENAEAGSKLFYKTRRSIENGIDWAEKHVRKRENLC